jgi:peptide/nickel transport system substrate-binding protein
MPAAGGWQSYLASPAAMEMLDPLANRFLNSSCEKASPGWPCDPTMEGLRDQFVREIDAVSQKKIDEAIQVRATKWTPYKHLGQWVLSAARTNVTGFIAAGPKIYWNVEQK